MAVRGGGYFDSHGNKRNWEKGVRELSALLNHMIELGALKVKNEDN